MDIMLSAYRHIVAVMLLVCWGLLTIHIAQATALTPEDQYYQAETCYRKLRNNLKKKKYRHNWLACIDKFQGVYRQDPSGPWAAAGLYMSGEMYAALYKYSNKPTDRKEALDLFERIIKRFPRSRYKKKAEQAIRGMAGSREKPDRAGSPTLRAKKRAQTKAPEKNEAYFKAEACYKTLRDNPEKQKYRHHWLACIGKFQNVHQADPTGPFAAASLYMSGILYREMYRHSYRASDKTKALECLQDVVARYPYSGYVPKSMAAIRELSPRQAEKMAAAQEQSARERRDQADAAIENLISQNTPPVSSPAETDAAEAAPSKAPSDSVENGDTTVTGLRFWSNPNYTRVVIDADRETTYEHLFLKKDPSIQKPQRLVVDLNNSRLKKDIEKVIPIHDDLLSDIRAGQNAADVVRVVIDIKSSKTYKIFSLRNPFRIVIDVWGLAEDKAAESASRSAANKGEALAPGALAKQLALGVRRIVIDPGHGGKDYGAPGYFRGVHEKYVILKIAKQLARKVKEQLDCEVILTRDRDEFLTLEERTAIANTRNADLFISLHANSSRDRRAYGIETYFLNLATDNEAIMVAATENATSTKNISDLQMILSDLMQNAKINESSRLAAHVQESLCRQMKKKYNRINNKGVKQAPFYVLLGAQMPAILIETSFISNKRECSRLTNATYQERLCEAIVSGIRNYIKEINPTAFYHESSKG